MNTLRRQNVRLAPWVDYVCASAQQVAALEDKRVAARSWLRYGQRRQVLNSDVQAAPMVLHPKQAGD